MSTPEGRCALYLRSSKDRHDVSIDAQRRSLVELAAAKSLTIAAEYSDAVEAANDWSRAGFRSLLVAVNSRTRGWSTLLVHDTSRLARDVHLAGVFRAECRKNGVTVAFKRIPETDPLSDLIIGHVYQLLDHIHSHLSREKGLAGMAENVRRGFRAGGSAPYGFQLAQVATGAIRDGAPVTKTRLVPSADAPAIAEFLRRRAAGHPARQAARDAGVKLSPSSLVDVEWRALTYAGHTVWNQSRSKGIGAGGYEGATKRRPRVDWQIQRGTHPALITDEQAEKILQRLEQKRVAVRDRGDRYLLSGIVVDQAGRRWYGSEGFYRCGRRRLAAANLERQVLEALRRDLLAEGMVRQLTDRARATAAPAQLEQDLDRLKRRGAELDRQLGRVRNVITLMERPEAMAPKLDELMAEKQALDRQAAELAAQASTKRVHSLITEADVRAVVHGLLENLEQLDRGLVKARLRALFEKITVDPTTLNCRIFYAIPLATGFSVASPRGAAAKAGIRIVCRLELTGFRRAA
jgi:site-specific DNA recombinase